MKFKIYLSITFTGNLVGIIEIYYHSTKVDNMKYYILVFLLGCIWYCKFGNIDFMYNQRSAAS